MKDEDIEMRFKTESFRVSIISIYLRIYIYRHIYL